jgi:hypothetical protein
MSDFDSEDLPIGGAALERVGARQTKPQSFRISETMKRELKEAAFYTDKSQGEILEEAFELWKAANPLIK